MEKRGQVTIFIILAIIIIAIGISIYIFYPRISSALGFAEANPSEFMQSCLEKDLINVVGALSLQGGSLSPQHYISYNGDKIEYLCYSEEYYKTCVIQQPMLKKHIEEEIDDAIKDKSNECLNSMKENYENRGYKVNMKSNSNGTRIELLPKKIAIIFGNTLTLTKESSKTYDSISIVINNNIYELISIANSILGWETRYGDAETTTYMDYYPELKVEKKKQSEGSTIYILTDRNSNDKFQFASRSVVWPPGYGASNIII